LTLPAAGWRFTSSGALNYRGTFGYYWSSTEGAPTAGGLGFTSSSANTAYSTRTLGFSVRCVSLIPATSTVFIAPGVSKEFMSHNLGANTALDPHTPVQGIHGNYYQWGRSTVVADASTPAGAISGWNTTTAANGAWQDGSKTANDPCPAGYRVPTRAQWAGVIANNTVSITSNNSWAAGDANFGSAIHWGPNVSTKSLTLPAAGVRDSSNGALNYRGSYGFYWSSTENGPNAYYLYFNTSNAYADYFNFRAYGFSVRCVSE